MEKDQYDYLLKFIIIGNSNSGKSCLLHYFLENKCWKQFYRKFYIIFLDKKGS